MRWIYMTMKMRRMSHGRSRDFPERNGSRSFLGCTDSDRDRTGNGKKKIMRKRKSALCMAVHRPVRFRQSSNPQNGNCEYAQQANSCRIGTVKKWRWSLQTRESVDVQQVFVLFNVKRQTRYTRAGQRRAVNMIRAPPKGINQ